MRTKMIAIVALMTTTMSGAAYAAERTHTAYLKPASSIAAQRVNQVAAEKEYARRVAEYQKNRAAYEADPTIWTADVPVKPAKPSTNR